MLSLSLKSPGKKRLRNSSVLLSHAQGTIVHHSCYWAPFSGVYKDYTSFKKVFDSIFVSESLANWMLEQPMPRPGAAWGGGELRKAPSPREHAKGLGHLCNPWSWITLQKTLFQVFKIDSVASFNLRNPKYSGVKFIRKKHLQLTTKFSVPKLLKSLIILNSYPHLTKRTLQE